GDYEAVRAALAARLEAQVVLQRGVIDSVAELRKLGTSDLSAEQLGERLDRLAQQHAQALAAPEHASLPRHLINEFAAEHASPAAPARPGPDEHLLHTLHALEAPLQQGSLGSAAEHDKALKEAKGIHLSGAQSERLAHARSELKRLSDWARWGGNVSREELIK